MSVYAGEKPDSFRAALESLLPQRAGIDEFIIVRDGPIGSNLEVVIEEYASLLDIRQIELPENVGLASALTVGLKTATQPWIMRFDSDDVCCSNRVARQRALISSGEFDLIGGQIGEFISDHNVISRTRQVPELHSEIVRFARSRNPFNHMTVCFKRDLALRCGGYPNIRFMEDYALWVLMILAGARTFNDREILVKARVGNGMVRRRGGFSYVRSEVKLQSFMIEQRFKSRGAAVLDGLVRSLVFLSPITVRGWVYSLVLRK